MILSLRSNPPASSNVPSFSAPGTSGSACLASPLFPNTFCRFAPTRRRVQMCRVFPRPAQAAQHAWLGRFGSEETGLGSEIAIITGASFTRRISGCKTVFSLSVAKNARTGDFARRILTFYESGEEMTGRERLLYS
jgi:hypothetical protein